MEQLTVHKYSKYELLSQKYMKTFIRETKDLNMKFGKQLNH